MRRGFTLVELVVVLGLIAAIAGIALPVIMRLMERGAINKGADRILRAHRNARALALQQVLPLPGEEVKAYGVGIFPEGAGARVAVIYGSATAPDPLLGSDGNPVASWHLGTSQVWYGEGGAEQALDKPLCWFYLPRSGKVTRYGVSATSAAPFAQHFDQALVEVGVPPRPNRGRFTIEFDSASGTYRLSAENAWTNNRVDVAQRSTPALRYPDHIAYTHLSVRSADQRQRIGLSIYAIGMAVAEEF